MPREKLVQKLNVELDAFKRSVLECTKLELFDKSYEISKKIDIVGLFEYQEFSDVVIDEVLAKENSLDFLFQCFLQSDISLTQEMTRIFENILK
ncbi:MAG: DUF3848 domain-containing protein [Faecalibacterium sp.]